MLQCIMVLFEVARWVGVSRNVCFCTAWKGYYSRAVVGCALFNVLSDCSNATNTGCMMLLAQRVSRRAGIRVEACARRPSLVRTADYLRGVAVFFYGTASILLKPRTTV